jgi:hypothetical protein
LGFKILGKKCSVFAFFLEKSRKHKKMPSNKHASYRYRIIDECLRTSGKRKWTLEELTQRVGEKLVEEFGQQSGVCSRTIQSDITWLRRNYAAPIKVKAGCYFYEDPDYSIDKKPLNEKELHLLIEALALLQQFPQLPQALSLHTLLKGLKLSELPSSTFIQFEAHPDTKGLAYLPALYEPLPSKKCYKSITSLLTRTCK